MKFPRDMLIVGGLALFQAQKDGFHFVVLHGESQSVDVRVRDGLLCTFGFVSDAYNDAVDLNGDFIPEKIICKKAFVQDMQARIAHISVVDFDEYFLDSENNNSQPKKNEY